MPNALYRVELDTGHRIVAHVAPAARLRFLRVIPGDRVRVEVSRGVVESREKNNKSVR